MTTTFLIPQEITANLGIPQIIDIRDQLPVNSRYTWGQLERVRDINDITTVVMHHDGMSKASTSRYSDKELMIRIAENHIESIKNVPGGDAGFPYDIFIRNGKAYLCNDFLPLKYGVKSNNAYTLHVCVSGEYANYDVLTDPDRKVLVGVLLGLKRFLPAFQAFKGHKEIMPTQCPGYDYAGIRNDVTTLEMNLQFKQTDNAQVAAAFNVATRILNLYDTAKGNGQYAGEARRKLLLLEPKMKELGLLS